MFRIYHKKAVFTHNSPKTILLGNQSPFSQACLCLERAYPNKTPILHWVTRGEAGTDLRDRDKIRS